MKKIDGASFERFEITMGIEHFEQGGEEADLAAVCSVEDDRLSCQFSLLGDPNLISTEILYTTSAEEAGGNIL